ncbi:aminotransferase class III-fold pyridoxal phosphate-dependent enzyme [Aliiroseovarius sp. YM-037]|uniref:aminotransferase class III-fold pyridoxal phosphate-dependent enzyme n=1 Tax=Aliiroseovarius sp. YM-037 TaxID=3341728 RepID=UPI003A8112BF
MLDHWRTLLKSHWGIAASLHQLNGEYDLNFMVKCDDGKRFILKVMRDGCARDLIDMQIAALAFVAENDPALPVPRVVQSIDGEAIVSLQDEGGANRLCWLQTCLEGVTYARFKPKSAKLIRDLGEKLGRLDVALRGFKHAALSRDFKWNLVGADWITSKLDLIDEPTRRELLADILAAFADIKPELTRLPAVAIHNDVNDHNILAHISHSTTANVTGLIDFGDMCAAPRICELAIAAAYVVLDHETPEAALSDLVAGYHAAAPLTAEEVDLIWPLLRMRLAVSVVNSTEMAKENPGDPYVTISQAPAWRFLERFPTPPTLINARLRAACSLPVVDHAPCVMEWLDAQRGTFADLFGRVLSDAPMGSLSVESSTWPQNPFDMPTEEAARVGEEFTEAHEIWLGYYKEPRLIYTSPAFRAGQHKSSSRRTVHLAIDVFAPADTPLFAPFDGTVYAVENRDHHLDYGGVVILEHGTPDGDPFFTLYGHLNSDVVSSLSVGAKILKGNAFCRLGVVSQNGGWAPHVHFQLALTTEGMGDDWPGVADPDDLQLWTGICPNPAALLNLPDEKVAFQPIDKKSVQERRSTYFGPNLKLSYDDPVMFVRGWRHHLFDQWGRPYLDAYNNVPHVGHAHPRIQAVAADQLKRLNTNTRYLHPAQAAFAEKITSKLPDQLSVCFFVNSGTEANELALRLARAHTGGKAMITPDHGYHGNTTGAMDISAYKFNAPGGAGQPDWVELVEVADDYRGSFDRQDADRAKKLAIFVDDAIARIATKDGKLAGFIAETFPSVGGQIIPPNGYLPAVYDRIRAAGGICIADEVQTGLGRLGHHYFGFEHQGAVPDIVVMGKPIGNGHPLGVLVTTPAIAESFAQGPEFFSTFGGSTLSCRIGKEVLDIVDDEGLMENARNMGDRLLASLADLKNHHTAIGDVRGMGLFVGVDLVTDRQAKTPATALASYVKNRLRECRILVGTEGPADNILKIRPPLTIDTEDIDLIVKTLDSILSETASAAHLDT